MSQRIQLHKRFEELLGSENVYFQPPPSVQMEYDCIVYERSRIDSDFANNQPYALRDRYQVTLIYGDPDSELPKKLAQFPMCSFETHFTADNMNHDVFNLYF